VISDIDLDHVAVAVERWSDAWPHYRGDLSGEWVAGGAAPGFSSAQLRYANGMKIEVLEPNLVDVNDFLRRFLDRNGPGPHHLTYKVADIQSALADAEASGYRPVGVDLSMDDWKEAFLHPKDAPGVVVQLAESHGSWASDPPADLPAARMSAPATLVHVAHAVASLDEGTRLFVDLLGGKETARGEDATANWLDLAWPGPGRVRLAEPTSPSSPLSAWLDGRAGRVHHIGFATQEGSDIGAASLEPPLNNGVRLCLVKSEEAFRGRFDG
jgi:methylmalonyl-CoA/ethylmalonyl-CoA epimerase